MIYVWDKIIDILVVSWKILCVGVVGLRIDEIDNKFQDDDGYENILVLQELVLMSMLFLWSL